MIFVLLALFAPSQSFSGNVVSVHDGDTITVLVDKTQIKVRLDGIDAPESKQAFGSKAKQALSEKIVGKQFTVEWSDRYGRTIGKVRLETGKEDIFNTVRPDLCRATFL
jgi:micrococcal nuclease